jgi:hypothetical protein
MRYKSPRGWMHSLRGGPDHRQDAGLDRLGQLGPGAPPMRPVRPALGAHNGVLAGHPLNTLSATWTIKGSDVLIGL